MPLNLFPTLTANLAPRSTNSFPFSGGGSQGVVWSHHPHYVGNTYHHGSMPQVLSTLLHSLDQTGDDNVGHDSPKTRELTRDEEDELVRTYLLAKVYMVLGMVLVLGIAVGFKFVYDHLYYPRFLAPHIHRHSGSGYYNSCPDPRRPRPGARRIVAKPGTFHQNQRQRVTTINAHPRSSTITSSNGRRYWTLPPPVTASSNLHREAERQRQRQHQHQHQNQQQQQQQEQQQQQGPYFGYKITSIVPTETDWLLEDAAGDRGNCDCKVCVSSPGPRSNRRKSSSGNNKRKGSGKTGGGSYYVLGRKAFFGLERIVEEEEEVDASSEDGETPETDDGRTKNRRRSLTVRRLVQGDGDEEGGEVCITIEY